LLYKKSPSELKLVLIDPLTELSGIGYKNVITEDDILNPVWNDLSSPRNQYQLEHGAVYPVKLCERLIKMYSKEEDTIFDPFLGIGSTMIAAQNLNRHCIGTELNPK